MVEAKRSRGRPRGARNKAAKPSIAPELEALLETEAAGNGRDEVAHDPDVRAVDEFMRSSPTPRQEAVLQPQPPPRVALPDLFVHRVENGYIVRPAYAQGDHRTSSDVRTWVVATKEALAALVVELLAEPVVHATPQRQSQDYYSPPLIVETGVGPMR